MREGEGLVYKQSSGRVHSDLSPAELAPETGSL